MAALLVILFLKTFLDNLKSEWNHSRIFVFGKKKYQRAFTGSIAIYIAFFSVSAQAIIGGIIPDDSEQNRVDVNSAASRFAGVGSIITPRGSFSGVLVAPNFVLTAGHVLNGVSDPSQVQFQINTDNAATLQASQFFSSPVAPTVDAFGFVHHDLALIKLTNNAPVGIPNYPLYDHPLATDDVVTLVGYGQGGNGIDGLTSPRTTTIKRTGENTIDLLVPGNNNPLAEIFVYDFDGPAPDHNQFNFLGGSTLGNAVEATVAPGDSGGPAFIFDNGVWKIAGVNTFATSFSGGPQTSGTFGTGGGGVTVFPDRDWITTTIAPVPEPSLWMSLLFGLATLITTGYPMRKVMNSKS